MNHWPGKDPWPHQAAAFGRCVMALSAAECRGLVVMPTGTGKSRVMRAMAYKALEDRTRAVLCLPTEEILQQLAADLRRETRVPFYVEKAAARAPSYSLITLASHQTLWRRLPSYDPSARLLFDEGHHGHEGALRNLSTLRRFRQVLAFTASETDESLEVYRRVLYRYGLQQAIQDGYLCTYELRPFPELVPPATCYELYYCSSNEEARQLARSCPGAAYLGHDTDGRDHVVTAFRSGRLKRLYLNRMLVEGFDCPDVAIIYIDKAPDSEVLTYQMVGRGLRRKKDGRGLVVYCRDVEAVRAALERAG